MNNFKKTIRLAVTKAYVVPCSIFCKIEFSDGKLSISGVEGPKHGGVAIGACGQINMHLGDEQPSLEPVNGMTRETMARFFDVWGRYHLNDMKAGDAAQEEFLRNNPIPKEDYAYPKSYYHAACAHLAAHGLNPHEGYSYGHAWKREEVPADVIDFLQSLPDSDVVPAWV